MSAERCSGCGAEVEPTARTGGLPRKCGDCRRSTATASRRRLRLQNAAAVRANSREYLAANPAKRMLYSAKVRARKQGLAFNLVEADVVVPQVCPVLGMALKTGTGPRQKNSPSLDRIDPHKGYVRGNIAVISDFANRIKQDATVDQVEAVARWMREQQDK